MNIGAVLTNLPSDEIVAAMQDPTNLGKEAAIAESLIGLTMPGLPGAVLAALVALFVAWVYASGGGTIGLDAWPERDAQLSHGGGDLK